MPPNMRDVDEMIDSTIPGVRINMPVVYGTTGQTPMVPTYGTSMFHGRDGVIVSAPDEQGYVNVDFGGQGFRVSEAEMREASESVAELLIGRLEGIVPQGESMGSIYMRHRAEADDYGRIVWERMREAFSTQAMDGLVTYARDEHLDVIAANVYGVHRSPGETDGELRARMWQAIGRAPIAYDPANMCSFDEPPHHMRKTSYDHLLDPDPFEDV